MFVGCTIMMAALAATVAAITSRARGQNNHAMETLNKCALILYKTHDNNHDSLQRCRLVSWSAFVPPIAAMRHNVTAPSRRPASPCLMQILAVFA